MWTVGEEAPIFGQVLDLDKRVQSPKVINLEVAIFGRQPWCLKAPLSAGRRTGV